MKFSSFGGLKKENKGVGFSTTDFPRRIAPSRSSELQSALNRMAPAWYRIVDRSELIIDRLFRQRSGHDRCMIPGLPRSVTSHLKSLACYCMKGPRRYRIQKIQTPISIPNRRGNKKSSFFYSFVIGPGKRRGDGGEAVKGNLARPAEKDALWGFHERKGRVAHCVQAGLVPHVELEVQPCVCGGEIE